MLADLMPWFWACSMSLILVLLTWLLLLNLRTRAPMRVVFRSQDNSIELIKTYVNLVEAYKKKIEPVHIHASWPNIARPEPNESGAFVRRESAERLFSDFSSLLLLSIQLLHRHGLIHSVSRPLSGMSSEFTIAAVEIENIRRQLTALVDKIKGPLLPESSNENREDFQHDRAAGKVSE